MLHDVRPRLLEANMAVAEPSSPQFHRALWLQTHVHDLSSLAAFTSQSGVVVCSVFTEGHREMAANWMYALSRFGGVKEALLFTFDEDSLRECLVLGFACFDGLTLLPNKRSKPAEASEIQYGDSQWFDVSSFQNQHGLLMKSEPFLRQHHHVS